MFKPTTLALRMEAQVCCQLSRPVYWFVENYIRINTGGCRAVAIGQLVVAMVGQGTMIDRTWVNVQSM